MRGDSRRGWGKTGYEGKKAHVGPLPALHKSFRWLQAK